MSQHLVRPASWGLFASAGMESGAFYDGLDTPTVSSSEARWKQFAAALGCDGSAPSIVECLVDTPADAIYNLSISGWGDRFSGPVVDGEGGHRSHPGGGHLPSTAAARRGVRARPHQLGGGCELGRTS